MLNKEVENYFFAEIFIKNRNKMRLTASTVIFALFIVGIYGEYWLWCYLLVFFLLANDSFLVVYSIFIFVSITLKCDMQSTLWHTVYCVFVFFLSCVFPYHLSNWAPYHFYIKNLIIECHLRILIFISFQYFPYFYTNHLNFAFLNKQNVQFWLLQENWTQINIHVD